MGEWGEESFDGLVLEFMRRRWAWHVQVNNAILDVVLGALVIVHQRFLDFFFFFALILSKKIFKGKQETFS